MQLHRRAIITTDGFAALARYLNATPGRKSLIWLSGSFPLSFVADENQNVDTANLTPVQNTYSDLVRKTTNLLAESHIAVYPVNARGLMVDVLPGMDENPNPSALGMPGSGAPAIAHVSEGVRIRRAPLRRRAPWTRDWMNRERTVSRQMRPWFRSRARPAGKHSKTQMT